MYIQTQRIGAILLLHNVFIMDTPVSLIYNNAFVRMKNIKNAAVKHRVSETWPREPRFELNILWRARRIIKQPFKIISLWLALFIFRLTDRPWFMQAGKYKFQYIQIFPSNNFANFWVQWSFLFLLLKERKRGTFKHTLHENVYIIFSWALLSTNGVISTDWLQ